jgi:hypothetical protein
LTRALLVRDDDAALRALRRELACPRLCGIDPLVVLDVAAELARERGTNGRMREEHEARHR